MALKLYVAAEFESAHPLLTGKHLTLGFMDELKETSKLDVTRLHRFLFGVRFGLVKLEYWEAVDLTVAIPDSDVLWWGAHHYLDELGFYDSVYDFRPHITLGKGNMLDKWDEVKNYHLDIRSVYLRIKDFPELTDE